MTTPDYADWTTAVRETEVVSQFTSLVQHVPNSTQTAVFDTSNMGSVALALASTNNTAGVRFIVQLIWFEGFAEVFRQSISFGQPGDYQGGVTGIEGTFPVRGSSVALFARSSDGSDVEVTMWGSTRIVTDVALSTNSNQQARMLMNSGNIAVGAGLTVLLGKIPPVAKALSLVYSGLVASTSLRLDGIDEIGGAVATTALLRVAGAATSVGFVNPIAAPLIATELFATNNTAASVTIQAQVWGVS